MRLWRWLSAPPAPEPIETGFLFDAMIDLGPGDVRPGQNAAAMRAVREAVAAIPGAAWVNAGRHDGLGAIKGIWVRVVPPGGGTTPDTPSWAALKQRVQAVAQAALDALAPDAAMPVTGPDYAALAARPPGRTPGFADGSGFQPVPIRQTSGTTPLRPALPIEGVRARIAAGEAGALDDAALTRALLSLVLPADPAPLAATIVGRFGSFAGVLSAPVAELQAVPGLGPHSVAAIKLVHAASLRASQAGLMHRLVLDDMPRLTDYLSAVLARERIEQFRILFLDGDRCLIADEAQARGTVNHTPVYPREVVRRALELRAASLVLVHNHPSGDPTPSREDLEMTGMVRDAAALLGIVVQDHIIVGNGQWVSFREAGLLSLEA